MIKTASTAPSLSGLTWQSQFGLLYLLCIFGFSALSFDRSLLDYTLLPRYGCAALVFSFSAIFILIKGFSKNDIVRWPLLDWPMKLLLAYVVWSTLSVTWATNFSEAIFESQKGMLGFAAYYFCRWFQLNEPKFISHLLKTIIGVSIVCLVLACWQFFQIDSNNINAQYEVRGISGHKNLFSTVLFLLLAFLSIGYFTLEKSWRKAAGLLFLLTLVLILFLKTRSVYLALLVTGTLFLFSKIKQQLSPKLASIFIKTTAAIVLLTLLGFLYAWQTNQLIPLLQASKVDQLWQSDTGYERLMLWEKTASVIRENFLCGVGAGNWQIEYPNFSVHGLYSVELDFTTFQRPHNDWLWVWAETGIVGLLCYLGFFLAIVYTALQNFKKEALDTNRLAAKARLLFIVGFMTIACFSFPKERVEILLLLYTLMGLFALPSPKQNTLQVSGNRLVLVLIILSSVFSLFICKERMKGESAMREVLVLKQQKNWEKLIEASDRAFSKWYTVDPTTIPIHWYRGTAQFVLGREKAAMEDFLKAEQYSPFNQHIQNDLGSCNERLGRKDEARGYYKEATRISPLFDDPRLNLAISYYNDGQYQKALDLVNSLRNHDLKVKYREIIQKKLNKNKSE